MKGKCIDECTHRTLRTGSLMVFSTVVALFENTQDLLQHLKISLDTERLITLI